MHSAHVVVVVDGVVTMSIIVGCVASDCCPSLFTDISFASSSVLSILSNFSLSVVFVEHCCFMLISSNAIAILVHKAL